MILDLSAEGKSPFYLDLSPGVSLENQLQAIYNERKKYKDGK